MPTAHTHQSSVNISNTAITAASADPKNEDDEDCDLDSRIFSHVQHLASLETNPPRSKKSSTRTSGVSAASSTESQVLIGTLELRETAHRVRQKRALENETRSERVEFLTQPTRLGSLQIESGWIKLPERDGGESATVTDHSSESTGSSLTVSKLHSRAASISSAHEENNDVMPNGSLLRDRRCASPASTTHTSDAGLQNQITLPDKNTESIASQPKTTRKASIPSHCILPPHNVTNSVPTNFKQSTLVSIDPVAVSPRHEQQKARLDVKGFHFEPIPVIEKLAEKRVKTKSVANSVRHMNLPIEFELTSKTWESISPNKSRKRKVSQLGENRSVRQKMEESHVDIQTSQSHWISNALTSAAVACWNILAGKK